MKCDRYWPDKTSSPPQPRLRYGDIVVSVDTSEPMGPYVLRRFTLQRDGEERVVNQFCFTAWPEEGVPSDASDLIELQHAVYTASGQGDDNGAPTVVHCSSGVGRTGV